MPAHIFLVEDDEQLGLSLSEDLSDDYQFSWAKNVADALDWLSKNSAQIVLLDLNLPDGDGLTVLESLRKHSNTPVLILSARSEVQHRVRGLNAGADDYLNKPFAMPELRARLSAMLRRTSTSGGVELGSTTLSTSTMTIACGGHTHSITEHEARILELMMRTPERVFSREDIESHVYGFEGRSSNTVEVRISQLRKKLLAIESDLSVRTIRGVGYVLQRQK